MFDSGLKTTNALNVLPRQPTTRKSTKLTPWYLQIDDSLMKNVGYELRSCHNFDVVEDVSPLYEMSCLMKDDQTVNCIQVCQELLHFQKMKASCQASYQVITGMALKRRYDFSLIGRTVSKTRGACQYQGFL